MKITYDREADALYIRFKDCKVTTKKVADGIHVDFDQAQEIAGIEILDAQKRFGDGPALRSVILEGLALSNPKK